MKKKALDPVVLLDELLQLRAQVKELQALCAEAALSIPEWADDCADAGCSGCDPPRDLRARLIAAGDGKKAHDLYWHCLDCGAHELVQPTGDSDSDGEYVLGDHEPCITCDGGEAHVMTSSQCAHYEQGRATGMSKRAALAHAKKGEDT